MVLLLTRRFVGVTIGVRTGGGNYGICTWRLRGAEVEEDGGMRSYGQFCPVAKAAEIVAERWTLLVVRELLAGSRRFNDLRRGVPLMSPSLLTKRLRELERSGIIERRPLDVGRGSSYHLTPAGEELRPVVQLLGAWGDRWVNHRIGPEDLDPAILMWDVRRRLVSEELPAREAVVCFCFREAHSGRRWWWLVVNGDEVDLCLTDPGREVDLTVRASLEAMIRVWVGRLAVEDVLASGEVALDGSAELARSFPRWIGVPSRVDELEDALSRVSLAASGDRGDPRSR
jgi:DNA-binding HxlR family transcriptional regulator